jgi:vacuolar-type H+-ATPase subunit I/STV1
MLWKNAKLFINDELFVRMSDYWPPGPKEDDYREYEKLMFVQSSISSYSEEAVEDYSTALGKILKWIKVAIQVRVEDVRQRRAAKEALDNERKEALEKEKERMEKRTAAHDEAKAVFDEKTDADWAEKKAAAEAAKAEDEDAEELDEDDKPEFDADDWFANFDDENPAGEVPEEVEDDMDNDFNIPIESPEDEEDA